MKPEDCEWVRKRFKKNKVWLAVGPDGQPLVSKNRVLIKYQRDQAHEYWVKPESVQDILDDEGHPSISQADAEKTKTPKPREKAMPGLDPPKESRPPVDLEDDKDMIVIYTDGASSGNPGPSGIGVVMRFGTHEREISRYIGISTNNIAELTAIETALAALKRTDLPVRLHTDSSYACGLLVSGWKARKNIPLINHIRHLMTRFKELKIIKVRGHSGISANERADQLATAAIVSRAEPA